MEKKAILLVVGIIIVCLVIVGFYLYNQEEINKNKEDISSYQIKDRYGCKQIQDDEEYNNCLKFYLEKSPYKLGEKLVPIRPIE
jgi:predicted negative regulator of RcsB-dependent stress response